MRWNRVCVEGRPVLPANLLRIDTTPGSVSACHTVKCLRLRSSLLLCWWQSQHSDCQLLWSHTAPPSLIGVMWSVQYTAVVIPWPKHRAQSGFACLCRLLSRFHRHELYTWLLSFAAFRSKGILSFIHFGRCLFMVGMVLYILFNLLEDKRYR